MPIASLTPVATWPEFAARYPAVGRLPELDALRIAPKHAVLVPDFVKHRRIKGGWLDARTAEQRAAIATAIANETALALGAVDDRVRDDIEDPTAEWRPVADWDAFATRYPDLASTAKSVSNLLSYNTTKDALLEVGPGGGAYDRFERALFAGDFMLLLAALRNEESLAEWIKGGTGRDGSPWNPRSLPLVQARIRIELPDSAHRNIVLRGATRLDSAIRAFWYYYVAALDLDRLPRRGDLERKTSTAASPSKLASSGRGGQRSSPTGGGSSRGQRSSPTGGGGAPGGPPIETKEERDLVSVVERRRTEETAAERVRVAAEERLRAVEARETLFAAERARIVAAEAEEEDRRAAKERKRYGDIDRMFAEVKRLFPDQAEQVRRILRI